MEFLLCKSENMKMGWVSCLDDIIDRANELQQKFAPMRADFTKPRFDTVHIEQRIEGFLRECRSTLDDLLARLEAAQVELRGREAQLEQRWKSHDRKLAELPVLKRRVNQLRDQLAAARNENRRLSYELERYKHAAQVRRRGQLPTTRSIR